MCAANFIITVSLIIQFHLVMPGFRALSMLFMCLSFEDTFVICSVIGVCTLKNVSLFILLLILRVRSRKKKTGGKANLVFAFVTTSILLWLLRSYLCFVAVCVFYLVFSCRCCCLFQFITSVRFECLNVYSNMDRGVNVAYERSLSPM